MALNTPLPNINDLSATWAFLEEGIEQLMNQLQSGVSYSKYMSLYTVAYNYCTASNKGNSTIGGTAARGSEVYSHLTRYLVTHLKSIRQHAEGLHGLSLLQYYAQEWQRYTTGADYINRLFTYLNRHWVRKQREEGRKGVYKIYTLALAQWKTCVFNPLQSSEEPRLTNATLRLIEQQRDGETVDLSLLKRVIESFVSVGLDEHDPDQVCTTVYKEQLEAQLLEDTDRYYKMESLSFLSFAPVPDYLRKVEDRLKQEEDRLNLYLHHSTTDKLLNRCETVLIYEHRELLWADFQRLLDHDQEQDLQRMYTILSRISHGLDPLRTNFAEHVKASAFTAVSRLVAEGESGGIDRLEPKAYVDTLLEVHDNSRQTVIRCFKGEAGFMASLDKACTGYMNINPATGSSTTKSPELLSKHVDLLLRKNNKLGEENELESALNNAMVVFKYLADKDVFQSFYATKLSKRLIHGVSGSEESEASMISKLKDVCGFEYTNRLQRMFTGGSLSVFVDQWLTFFPDMSLSKDLTEQFRAHSQQSSEESDLNFTIMVLGTNFWPLIPPSHDFVIPRQILPTFDRFLKYYQAKHSGRRLTWLWNYSKNELRTNYLNQKYILMTSSYQMAVLLQYNDNETLSLSDLISATSIPKDLLVQVLGLLVKARVLINDETDQYDLNPDFKSKRIRINLNYPIKAEVTADNKQVMKHVEDDRRYVIQATIVRIMKARKTMKNQALIGEVVSQISQRFTPNICDIKKAIETLLEKDYLERSQENRDTFRYVA